MTLNAQWLQEVAYPARADRAAFGALWDEGVFSTVDFKVTPRALGENMSVDIAVGRAVVEGDDQDFQGSYLVSNDALINKPVGFAPGALSRYDLVVLRVYDTNASMTAPGDYATIEVIAGAVAGAPVPPAVPDTAIPLAVIGPINPGTVLIDDSLISYAPLLLAGERDRPGTMKPYMGSIAPNGWVFMFGQSAAAYPALVDMGFATIPDMRGRVPVGLDNMGGVDAGRISSANVLGTAGGASTHTLVDAEMPVHDHSIDHDHGNVTSSGQSATHTHPIDHDHGSFGSGAGSAHSHGDGTLATGTQIGTHTHPAGNAQNFATADGVTTGYDSGAFDAFTVPQTVASTGTEFGDHTHDVTGSTADEAAHTHPVDVPNFAGGSGNTSGDHTHDTNLPNFAGTSGAAGGDAAHNNMQPYLTVNWIMRAAA